MASVKVDLGDELLNTVGGCGMYQLFLATLSESTTPVISFTTMLMVFGALEPDWWNLPSDASRQAVALGNGSDVDYAYNVSLSGWGLVSENANRSGSGNLSYSEDLNLTDLELPMNSEHPWFKVCPADSDSGSADRSIVFDHSINTVVSQFQLVCGKSWVPGMMFSLQMFGVLVGSTVTGQLSDLFGRRKMMLVLTILHTILCLSVAFSSDWIVFTVLRTLIGVVTGGMGCIGNVYQVEFFSASCRAVMMGIPSWTGGTVIFSLMAWGLKDWVHVQIATAITSAACIPAWAFLPESYRWLLTKGRVDEAQAVLTKMAACNGRAAPSMQRLKEAGLWMGRQAGKRYHYGHLFSSWKLAGLFLIMAYMWLANSVSYYGITFGTKDLSGDFFLNLLLMSLVGLPPNLFIYVMAKKLGRRWSVFAGFLGMTLCCLAVIPVSLLVTSDDAGSYVNALCITARMMNNVTWSIAILLTLEVFPTVIRNIGYSGCLLVSRIGSILAPYTATVGDVHVMYAIFGAMSALATVLSLAVRETRDEPLPDDLQAAAPDINLSVLTPEDEEQLHKLRASTDAVVKEKAENGQDI